MYSIFNNPILHLFLFMNFDFEYIFMFLCLLLFMNLFVILCKIHTRSVIRNIHPLSLCITWLLLKFMCTKFLKIYLLLLFIDVVCYMETKSQIWWQHNATVYIQNVCAHYYDYKTNNDFTMGCQMIEFQLPLWIYISIRQYFFKHTVHSFKYIDIE